MNPTTHRRLHNAALIFLVLGFWLTITALIPRAVEQRLHELELEAPDVVAQASEEFLAEPVEQRILRVAGEYGFDDGPYLIRLARCESGLNPNAVGGRSASFRGLYQWNRLSNPEVTDECAFSVECSTETTIVALNRGETWRWPNCAGFLKTYVRQPR